MAFVRGGNTLFRVGKGKYLILALSFALITTLSGCAKVDQLKVKFGLKNNDFEYIKQGKIQKIYIKNTRDPGFRFVVTDKKAISELYDILAEAKPAKNKSTLQPDYVFEMQEGTNKTYKFNYIAGLDQGDAGNFYNDDKNYIVSKRIDNDILQNFTSIRRPPKVFPKMYYDFITDQVEKYAENKGKGKTIGINLDDDVEMAKFIFSGDLEDFKQQLSSKVDNAALIEKPKNKDEKAKDYEVVMTVKTQGYKSSIYKAVVTFDNKKANTEDKYYIRISDPFGEDRWQTEVFTDKNKPSDF